METELPGFLTDSEKHLILEELSDELLINTIKDQIKNNSFELLEKKGHISLFEKRYINTLNYYKDNPDLVQQLEELRDNFYTQIEECLAERYGIRIDEELSDRYLLINAIYSHLVVNRKNTYINFFLNFIQTNRSSLATITDIKKSVDTLILKKKFKNKEILGILTNLGPIIDYVLNLELEPTEILRLSMEEGEINSFFIYSNMSKIQADNTFCDKFMDTIREDRTNYFNLLSTLRQLLTDEFRVNSAE